MEYSTFTDLIANTTTFNDIYVPQDAGDQMKAWMLTVPNLAEQYASMIVVNMPSPRVGSYEYSSFDQIKDNVLTYLSPIISNLGFYDVGANVDLLEEMHNYSYATLFIGLIFNILLLIFIIVSCLLVYSLLLISVETKKFEIGVMRLVGLTKGGFVGMILT